jgi:PTH1 family peptidyl-tRNA hydrolase
MPADLPWLVVGLGNPGGEYAGNRHNVGFMVADVLAARDGGRFKSNRRARAGVVEGHLGGKRVVLAEPSTYMNESGGPVASLREFFDVPADQVVVIHDELDLEFGVVGLKPGGGDNGHNGLRSITKSLGTNAYYRVRVGIGRPPGRMDPASYVLSDFGTIERRELGVHLEAAADIASDLVAGGNVRTDR